MNTKITTNYCKLKASLFVLPLCFVLIIVLLLYSQHALSTHEYVEIQKSYFFFLNSTLSQLPDTEYNLTQLGDALIFLSLLSVFLVYAPKLWESLISASLISAVFCCLLKQIFSIPRPAAVFDNKSFIVVGKTLCGSNSLPSGHSVTIFTVVTVLLFTFMPQKLKYKILWTVLLTILGLLLSLTRVGVGAHYPLDVVVGGIVGYMSGLTGIFFSRKYKTWSWINNTKYYPFLMLLLVVCSAVIIRRIINENLTIFYFSLIALIVSLYKIVTVYVKK